MRRWLAWGAGGLAALILLLAGGVWLLLHLNAVPEELKATPAAFMNFSGRAASASFSARGEGSAASRSALHWNAVSPPKTFEDYARFVRDADPSQPAAGLYLDVFDRLMEGNERLLKSWTEATALDVQPEGWPAERKLLWEPGGKLTQKQIAWLLAHQDFIAAIRQLIDAGGVPQMSAEEVAALPAPEIMWPAPEVIQNPVPDYLFFQTTSKMLAAEAQRLQAAGDRAGAAEVLADLVSYGRQSSNGGTLIGDLIAVVIRGIGSKTVDGWLSEGGMPRDEADRLQAAIDAGHLAASAQVGNLSTEWISNRKMSLYMAEAPWDIASTLGGLMIQPLPVIKFTWSGIWYKATAASTIREGDRSWEEFLDATNGTFEDVLRCSARMQAEPKSKNLWLMLQSGPSNYVDAIVRAYQAETGTNLDRAALRIVQGETAPAAPDTAAADWGASPWRDPFTEKPLRVEANADATLIYSLGPDLEDEGGGLIYDPTNGSMSKGDILIRLPR